MLPANGLRQMTGEQRHEHNSDEKHGAADVASVERSPSKTPTPPKYSNEPVMTKAGPHSPSMGSKRAR